MNITIGSAGDSVCVWLFSPSGFREQSVSHACHQEHEVSAFDFGNGRLATITHQLDKVVSEF